MGNESLYMIEIMVLAVILALAVAVFLYIKHKEREKESEYDDSWLLKDEDGKKTAEAGRKEKKTEPGGSGKGVYIGVTLNNNSASEKKSEDMHVITSLYREKETGLVWVCPNCETENQPFDYCCTVCHKDR